VIREQQAGISGVLSATSDVDRRAIAIPNETESNAGHPATLLDRLRYVQPGSLSGYGHAIATLSSAGPDVDGAERDYGREGDALGMFCLYLTVVFALAAWRLRCRDI
jgi:hypothetical protein